MVLPMVPVPPPSPPLVPFQLVARALALAGLVLLGGWIVRGFLVALAWAVILAVASWPVYQRVQRSHPASSRLLLPAVATLCLALILLLPLSVAALEIGHEAREAAHWLRNAAAHDAPAPAWVDALPLVGSQAAAWWKETLAAPRAGVSFLNRLSDVDLIGLGRQFGTALLHRTVLFGFTLLTLFFLFRDGEALARQGHRVSNRLFGPGSHRLEDQVIASVRGTVSGLVLVGLGEGLLLGLAYWIAGVPHWVLLAALTGVAAIIPFGAPVIFGVAALLLVAAGHSGAALGILAFGMLVLLVADHVIRPAMIGGATQLPFLWVLLGILGGVEVLGLIGLFVGPAVMAVLVLLWRGAAGEDGSVTAPGRTAS